MEGRDQAQLQHAEGKSDQGAGTPASSASVDAQLQTSRLVRLAVRRAQAGDQDAFAFLYARYADDVCAYVASIVRDSHEAEDVTQQVFAKLMLVIGKYEERDVPFFAWILRVARNSALDHLRRRRPVPVEEVRASHDAFDAPGTSVGELRDALATLPPAQREIIVLRHLVGLSPTEIALRTGRTESSVHGLHHRGRRALQAELLSRGEAPAIANPRRL
ncbi:MAG: sigma-70 family RNA polymerase sigma factor [Solirubrobacteraceae bacterium]